MCCLIYCVRICCFFQLNNFCNLESQAEKNFFYSLTRLVSPLLAPFVSSPFRILISTGQKCNRHTCLYINLNKLWSRNHVWTRRERERAVLCLRLMRQAVAFSLSAWLLCEFHACELFQTSDKWTVMIDIQFGCMIYEQSGIWWCSLFLFSTMLSTSLWCLVGMPAGHCGVPLSGFHKLQLKGTGHYWSLQITQNKC